MRFRIFKLLQCWHSYSVLWYTAPKDKEVHELPQHPPGSEAVAGHPVVLKCDMQR